MSSVSVLFNCYYNGKWRNSGKNLGYDGGDVKTIDCDPRELFVYLVDVLGVSLYEQRVWYKHLYESFENLKILCNGDENFQRMCEAAISTKMFEVFLEKDEDDDANSSGEAPQYENVITSDNGGEMCEEEARVENNLIGFVEEEEECNSEDTPPNSDCEEGEEAETRRHYDRYTKFSGEIRLEQTFDSIAEFKDAVVDYVLKTGWNVKYTRWGSEKSEVKCTIGGGCPFRIYCSFEQPIGLFMVKFYNDEHSCTKDGFSKVVKDGIIAKLFLNDIRRDPDFRPQAMQESLEERYDLVVSIITNVEKQRTKP
ncbi:uncharacterized protein LOC108816034 [Raphanus sativus]|uniref:Uncharacterized protein LOC108816034 n=1 Tax=Raphanus sativus TaxID=3726 RepID=A0A6J0K7W1_RAPSA|nr:uncharacterized protein LOC108816034 [Raphanus sativus]